MDEKRLSRRSFLKMVAVGVGGVFLIPSTTPSIFAAEETVSLGIPAGLSVQSATEMWIRNVSQKALRGVQPDGLERNLETPWAIELESRQVVRISTWNAYSQEYQGLIYLVPTSFQGLPPVPADEFVLKSGDRVLWLAVFGSFYTPVCAFSVQ